MINKFLEDEKPSDYNGSDSKITIEAGPDPTAPVTRRGILTSLLTGKQMEIPEQDVVSIMIN